MHSPINILVVDSLNRRILFGFRRFSQWKWKECFGLVRKPLAELVEMIGSDIDWPNVAVGVYAGPGPFSRLRHGVLFAHWVARIRTNSAMVSYISMKLLNNPRMIPSRWATLPSHALPAIKYGKKPNITKKG